MGALGLAASLAILALCAVTRPQRATCPPTMDLRTGVRADGHFRCWPPAIPDPRFDAMDYDGTFGRPEHSVQEDWVIAGRVYCPRGTMPIVAGWRTVSCGAAQ